jgi:hypothetical protein
MGIGQALLHPVDHATAEQNFDLPRRHQVTHVERLISCDILLAARQPFAASRGLRAAPLRRAGGMQTCGD